jgi:DNA-binding response OmpR family regulator
MAYGADARVGGDAQALLQEAERLVAAPRRRVVLVVEDNPAVRSVLIRLLRVSGYACLDAATATSGLELARTRKPDLIVTDLILPGKDGPVLVVSARTEREVRDEIRALNADFVPKPFQATTIVAEIQRILD